jgi:hypothetical protein
MAGIRALGHEKRESLQGHGVGCTAEKLFHEHRALNPDATGLNANKLYSDHLISLSIGDLGVDTLANVPSKRDRFEFHRGADYTPQRRPSLLLHDRRQSTFQPSCIAKSRLLSLGASASSAEVLLQSIDNAKDAGAVRISVRVSEDRQNGR